MSEAAIFTLKNHLPEWVHLAETGATIVSAFRRWREQYPDAQGFTDAEQVKMHQHTREPYPNTASVWD
jgi:hypothetical protein